MKRRIKKIGVVSMAAILLAFCVGSTGAYATSGNVSDARKKKEALESDLKEAQGLIEKLKTDKGDIEAAVEELDRKLTEISENISDLEEQTEEKNKQLENTQEQLKIAQEQETDQYESMKVRIRYMYENSGTTYLEVLLTSGSFAEFIKQADYFSTIMKYDRQMLAEYQETQEIIRNSEESIRQDKEDLEALQAQLEEEQEAVELLMAEKESQLATVKEGLTDAENMAEQYEQEIAAENQLIQEMLAAEAQARKEEEARKAAEAQKAQENSGDDTKQDTSESSESGSSGGSSSSGSSSGSSNVNTDNSYTGGVFTWPCPGNTRITSGFGYRDAPTAGASTYHQGYDIAAPAGSAIVAAADGVVTSTGYSSILGNYVILSHGGGLFTIYEHCSSVLVSKGQSVSRGSTIAKVGSTGVSTGPHLHFGVQLNGKYVDPGNYL